MSNQGLFSLIKSVLDSKGGKVIEAEVEATLRLLIANHEGDDVCEEEVESVLANNAVARVKNAAESVASTLEADFFHNNGATPVDVQQALVPTMIFNELLLYGYEKNVGDLFFKAFAGTMVKVHRDHDAELPELLNL